MILYAIGGGHHLAAGPARSYLAARAAGCPAGVTSSTRTTAQQAELRAAWEADPVNNAFALPAGQSRHEKGYALDLEPAPAAWMRAHPEYGWVFTNPREWWHAEWFAALDTVTAGLPAALIPLEDDMAQLVQGADDGKVYVTNWIRKRYVTSPAQLDELRQRLGGVIVVGQYTLDRIPVDTVAGPVDVNAIATAVVAKLPAGGPTATAIADELAARLAH